MATEKKVKKTAKKNTNVKKTNTKKKSTTKKSNTKKYSTKKPTTKKTNIKKKTVKKQPIKQQDLSDTQLLDIIQIKKAEKKLQQQTKPKDDDLIITREIDTSELQQYLQQEQEELENTLLLNELAEKVAERLEEEKSNENETELVIEKEESIVETKNENKKKSNYYEDTTEEITIGQLLSEDYDNEIDSKEEIEEIINKKNYKEITILVILILLFISICAFALYNIKPSNAKKEENNVKKETKEVPKETIDTEVYNNCLNKKYNVEDTNEQIEEYITDINSFLSTTYNVSIVYKDIERDFTYTYNVGHIYYAASTIKALEALYIYTKASSGEINLDDTLTYNEFYALEDSKYMSTKYYGDKIPIRELVKYSVEVSDNSAYKMLLDYVGMDKLREYGYSLGAKNTLNTGDMFGNISTDDAIHYMQAIYEFINSNPELGNELKTYFINAEQNGLALPENNIEAAHKYGEYANTYNDIGIVYDKHPYILVVLTEEGEKDFKSITKDISKKIYELHKLYYSNREEICKTKSTK